MGRDGIPGQPGNGRVDGDRWEADLDDEVDDDSPLDAEEAVAADLAAGAGVDQTLDERVAAVVDDLEGVERAREGDGVVFGVSGRVFAVLGPEALEVALDPAVARAALRTGDTSATSRGDGWIAFSPTVLDRFALDRAEAWLRSAHRRAAAR